MEQLTSMNPQTSFSLAARYHRTHGQRGVALLLVLASLVLLTTLILALLLSSQSNLKSSKLYANGSSVKTLADSTVSLVMAQIQQATSNGTTVAWASQPGMIRTYDNTGAPLTNYRLFSWDSPTISGAYDASTDETQISSSAANLWYNSPSVYVDLNQPVTDSSGTAHYPIVDGNPSDLSSYTTPAPASLPVSTYLTSGSPTIEGFWVTPPNTAAVAATGTAPATPAGPAVLPANVTKAGGNNIPMPVKWLYVLKDGTVVAPVASSSGTTVTVGAATTSNPIVGRIAYWTDDETAKININTASEGSYMDTPRAQGITDFGLAKFPPVQNEYQRYPGHPAMTCLSSVFNSLGTSYAVNHALEPTIGGYYTASPAATYTTYQPYYDMAPKLNLDTPGNLGSQAGTVSVTSGSAALTAKNDRLYASIDELMFASNLFTDNSHSSSTTLTGAGGTRPLTQTGTTPAFNQAFLEKAKFFITANSRAPDVNLFNQPRIVTWPLNATTGSAYRTVFDQAIAFCGTINGLPYYFQRARNDHPTNDLPATYTAGDTGLDRNRALLGYLQNLSSQAIPGFGGSFTSKYTVKETDQILTEIFDYIRCLNLIDQSSTAMTHPFAPVATVANGAAATYAGTNGAGSTSTLTPDAGEGSVVPIYDTVTGTKGFGRFPTISEVSLIFIATGWNDGKGGLSSDVNYAATTGRPPGPKDSSDNGNTATFATSPVTYAPWGYYNDGTNTFPATVPTAPAFETIQPTGTALPVIPGGNVQLQAALLINFFDPSQGNVWEYAPHSVQILGLDNFTWGSTSGSTTSMGFPGTSASNTACTTNMNVSSSLPEYASRWGGNMGFRSFFATEGAGLATTNNQYYPFFSGVQNFPYNPAGGGTFVFNGGDITINVLLPSNTPGWNSAAAAPSGWPANSQTASRPPIQQIKVTFPSATLPIPVYATASLNASGAKPCLDRGNFNYRFTIGSSNFSSNAEFIVGQDTVRSVRAYPGDIRMIAGQVSISDTQSSPAASPGYFDSAETKIKASGLTAWDYFNSSVNLVHSLRESIDYPFGGAILGQLVPVTAPNYSNQTAGTGFTTSFPNGLNNSSGAGNNATIAGAFIGGGTSGSPGDWDNGFGYTADGPYINKADEGDYNFGNGMPYFGETDFGIQPAGQTFFSPNHLMPGPGMFGSLSTGVVRNIPWQTLLFCPNPPAGPSHPGFGTAASGVTGPLATAPYTTPPDHLMLDLFNMPVVEPYPITEPLSTAGRINMNYQIVPFTYIERSTGMRAVLKAERMTVIPDSAASVYKAANGTSAPINANYDYRVPINSDQTLLAFDNYFSANKDIFRSASQICSMFLYPARDALVSLTQGPTWDSANKNITLFWNGNTTGTSYSISQTAPTNTSWPTHYLTGDNSRERPYATIYPRLTTKSNTYTIHYYVQTLQKVTGSTPTLWNENSDVVTGEYRGSTTVERYVDPNNSTLPDFTTATTTALDNWYKFRIVSTKQFAP